MKASTSGRYGLGICAAVVVLCGCSGLRAAMPISPPLANPQNVRSQTGSGFQSLHDFSGTPDGSFPLGGLVAVNGTLYGTTSVGGSTKGATCARFGCGVVFEISKSGSEHILYGFKGSSDGAQPQGSLTELDGALYGTTTYGGSGCQTSGGCGTVFKISLTGTEHVIYRFRGRTDGVSPQYNESLLAYKGALYGTTGGGGSYHDGTVYEVTPSGKERVLHSFGKNLEKDGAGPTGNLIAYEGTLYGSAYSFGKGNAGVVFAITTSGKERILYNFQGGSDGAEPNALIAVNGVFYGTTTYGGSSNCYGGCGTVFALTPSGEESVIYRFQGGSGDGANPGSGISLVTVTHHKGVLYGTTDDGGCPGGSPSGLCGTVFAVSTSGVENVLFNFQGFSNGFFPSAPLVSTGRMLYGTTYAGGESCYDSGGTGGSGCGTVFSISP
jgi:uncharacterized repeat protein (TIGR03803 family)